MFFHANSKLAVIAANRCGHTNMYHYFGIKPYSNDYSGKEVVWNTWKHHHNPIIVLRNPLDRVVSATIHTTNYNGIGVGNHHDFFVYHSYPFMHELVTCSDFRVIDFYNLEQYIPRRSDVLQSFTTYSHVDENTTAEDVYVQNSLYTLQELCQEVRNYKKLMATQVQVSVEEWKELTDGF